MSTSQIDSSIYGPLQTGPSVWCTVTHVKLRNLTHSRSHKIITAQPHNHSVWASLPATVMPQHCATPPSSALHLLSAGSPGSPLPPVHVCRRHLKQAPGGRKGTATTSQYCSLLHMAGRSRQHLSLLPARPLLLQALQVLPEAAVGGQGRLLRDLPCVCIALCQRPEPA